MCVESFDMIFLLVAEGLLYRYHAWQQLGHIGLVVCVYGMGWFGSSCTIQRDRLLGCLIGAKSVCIVVGKSCVLLCVCAALAVPWCILAL